MGKFVVLVDLQLKPDSVDDFRRLVIANARASLRDEAGCRQFDVFAPAGEGSRILLYEVYDSKAAFDEHLATPHLAVFLRESEALVDKKSWFAAELVFDSFT
jgi:quinol monooxygenase YgiN